MPDHSGNMDGEKEYYSHVKNVFDVVAPFYDIVTFPLLPGRDRVVNFSKAKPGSRVLDVATGTGKQAFAFGKKGCDVIGIDLSETMLRVANKNNKYKNVRFQVADATKLPFENASFDVSCVSFALHEMPLSIRARALEEMVRVTMPEGTIVIADYALPGNKVGSFLICHVVKLFEAYYEEFIRSDLEELLRRAGIEITGRLRLLFGVGRLIIGVRANFKP